MRGRTSGPYARLDLRESLDHLDERVIPFATAAVLLQRVVELVNERGARKRDVVCERVVEDEAQILLLQIDHETGPEVSGTPLRRVVVHRPRGSRATGDDLARLLEVDALRRGEHERFGHTEVVDGDGDLVCELAGLARAVIADVHDRLAQSPEEGRRTVHGRGGPRRPGSH